MFTTLRRLAEQASEHPPYAENPYPLKKVWPPDFSKLPPHSQFRFEKKYKRRLALKAARPRWDRAVKMTMWGSITFVMIYMCFHEFDFFDKKFRPIDAIRERLNNAFGNEPLRDDPRAIGQPKPKAQST